MPPLTFVILVVAVGLLAMIPTRRLFLAGWKPAWLTTYFLSLIGLGLAAALVRGPARYLVPILVIAYVAPFITARDGIARLRERLGGGPRAGSPRPPADGTGGRRPKPRNVTPPDAPG